jgi:hypothetical protein
VVYRSAIERTARSLVRACVASLALVVAAVQFSRRRRWCSCQRYTCGVCRGLLLCKPTAAGGPSSSYSPCASSTNTQAAACKGFTSSASCPGTQSCGWCAGVLGISEGCYLKAAINTNYCTSSDGNTYGGSSCPTNAGNVVATGFAIVGGVLIGIVGARPHSRLAAAAPPSLPYRQSSSPLPACTLSARLAGEQAYVSGALRWPLARMWAPWSSCSSASASAFSAERR